MLLLLLYALISLLVLVVICRIAQNSQSSRLRASSRRYLQFIDKFGGSDPLGPLIVLILFVVTVLFS